MSARQMRTRFRPPRPLGRLTAQEQREVDYGWQTLHLCVWWLCDAPGDWLRYHAARPVAVWRLLRLLWCCLIVTLLAEPWEQSEL